MTMSGRIVSTLVGCAFALAVTAAPASAGPPPGTPRDTGCPVGQETLDVDILTDLGYQVPERVDAAGNDDGVVCGRPLNDVQSDKFCDTCENQLYAFRDNTVANKK